MAHRLEIEVTTKTMVRAALVVAGAVVLLRLAPVVMCLVLALFLVGTLGPSIAWLEKRGVRRVHGTVGVFSLLFLGVGAVGALTLPPLVAQVVAIAHDEPALRARLAESLSHARIAAPLAESLRNLHYDKLVAGSAATAFAYSTHAAEVVAYLVSGVFLALYVMIDRDRLRGGLYAVVPRAQHIRLTRILLNLEVIVGGYIRGQLLTSALMASFTFVLLTACGVKTALALGVLAGAADIFPYVGVLLAVGPAVAAAWSRGPGVAAIVLVAMLAYEELESRILVPRIYGRALKLPSSIVLFALLVGGTLLGIPGALLALPVAAAIRMLVEELRIELPGEDVDDSAVRIRDATAEREYQRRAGGLPAEDAAAIAVKISEQRSDIPKSG
jgi:predicted PurR-regulated permease PerM